TGTSKANTAILHTGFDAKPGSLESRLLRRGSALLRAYAAEAGIAVERTGALLVAWTGEQLTALPGIEANARRNGYQATRALPVGGQRGRPGQRRDRRDVRRRRVYDHAAARRAHRVRQAGQAAAALHPAAGADRADQGGARRPHGVRERAARAHGAGRHGPVR